MSAALNKAIYRRLTGIETLTGDALAAQTALVALLATDPDTGYAAVYNMNLNDAQLTDGSGNKVPVYPCITFRQSGGRIYPEFQHSGAIERVTYDFEFWNDARSLTTISSIAEYVERLIDFRRGYVTSLPLDSGKVQLINADVPLLTHYDRNLHAWAGLVRYAIIEERY